MRILVDTSVWSQALRRKKTASSKATEQLTQLIEGGERIFIIGVILQEILSGIVDKTFFEQLAVYLSAFPMIALEREDYVEAARLRNSCKQKGVQAGSIDFLIASVCLRKDLLLFSLDKDFQSIATVSELNLI